MSQILKRERKYGLVLVDSLEFYDLRDTISKTVTSSLIEAIRQMYGSRVRNRILAKAAFPSEIYPHLSAVNKEKIEGKNLYILWRYKDLIRLLAKRYYYSEFGEQTDPPTLDFSQYVTSREYLYERLPPTVRSTHGVGFDTLGYIMKHTQKKPRQFIMLMNVILTLAERKGLDPMQVSEQAVRAGVHARLDILVEGILDVYDQVYPNCSRVVRRILTRAPSHFDYGTLDRLVSEASSVRTESNLSAEEAKRLLLECGALGIECGIHELPTPGHFLLEALFEYQVKGVITMSNRARFAIHPMLYQEFHAEVDRTRFVYPIPSEDEERTMLGELGIRLG